MFWVYPELLITQLVVEKMQNFDAVIMTGAKRFSNYEGYSHSTKFSGPFDD
jgi:hypothetical protein